MMKLLSLDLNFIDGEKHNGKKEGSEKWNFLKTKQPTKSEYWWDKRKLTKLLQIFSFYNNKVNYANSLPKKQAIKLGFGTVVMLLTINHKLINSVLNLQVLMILKNSKKNLKKLWITIPKNLTKIKKRNDSI